MSGKGNDFQFFSPLTTPLVARFKLTEKQKKADEVLNFSSDSDCSSIFITQSNAKRSKVIKQPKRQVIESIISSLESVNSDPEPEDQFTPDPKVAKHRKNIKKMKLTPDLIESDLSDIYSDCETSSPVKKSTMSADTHQSRKVQRFKCPEGFEEVDNIVDTALSIRKSADKEFWLIKTPWDFDISKLDTVNIPLGGSMKLPGNEDAKHFEVMAIPKSKEDVLKMSTLLANENHNSLVCGPSLAGQIHIMESYASLPLVEIQAQPATKHQIPCNLKQRYVPFGADSPVETMKANETSLEKKGKKRKHEEVEIRDKMKKKKKKKKHKKTEV